jgi:hypothetical protein
MMCPQRVPAKLLTVSLEAHARIMAWAERYSVTVGDVVDVLLGQMEVNGVAADYDAEFAKCREGAKRKRVDRATKANLSRRSKTKPRRSGGAN